jgi:hypothetical protein
MKKKPKQKRVSPDEVFSHGPLHIARYGKNIIWNSNWPEGTHGEMLKRAVAMYPDVVKRTDELVGAIAILVSELPPDKLLHRAWSELASRAIKIEAEADIDTDDAVALRMIDYIQSVIASVTPAEHPREEVTEEEWQTLRNNVGKLFQTLNLSYQICRTAKAKAQDPDYDDNVEEFYYKAQIYWCNVRGSRYQIHDVAYLRDMFLPHSAVLEDLFGLTAQQFIDELTKIWHALTFGIRDIFEEMKAFQRDTMTAVEAKLAADPPQSNMDLAELMQIVVAENGWQDRQERLFNRFFGTDLFDVQMIASLPPVLIDQLSWGPGEEPDFFAEGEFRGWPLRIWPIFKRPFIRLNERYYCFNLYSLFDNIYRVMQRIIWRLRPDYREPWNAIQQQQSEELPFKYLERILPGATVYRPVYYRWYARPGAAEKDWCEADGLLVYDDHLFIVEARAGAFTYTSPASDFPAFIASLKNLVLKPATQGQRFLDYLGSAVTVPIHDKDHNNIGELRKSDFRQITICPVTLDPFTEMAAQVQHLRKIGIDVGSHPVWVLALDDLRVYSDIFENPLWFLHYVDQRMRAFQSDIIQVDDELDHLGLYLKHNNYSLYAEEMKGESGAQINFTGYRSEIDKFFLNRLYDPAAPCPLKQETPARILEIVTFLSDKSTPDRAALASYLLDLDNESRESISNVIEQELTAQPTTRRPKPFSSHGGMIFTAFCYAEPWTERNADYALDHARAVLLLNKDEQRLLLEMTYTEKGALADVHWRWVKPAEIPPKELPHLKKAAERLRAQRVANAREQRRKIGRNESCPCGSGKKYKKCCLNR